MTQSNAPQINRRRFEATGMLAIEPRALAYEYVPPAQKQDQIGPVSLVYVRGPLLAHEEALPEGQAFDSYDAIGERLAIALEGPSRAVVLVIDSPGGVATGLFAAVEMMRARATAAGKKLVAYVEGQACSASYALACASSKIYLGKGSVAGSVGVINVVLDQTALDAAMGLKYTLITSGARKADGNPHQEMSPEALRGLQSLTDTTADVFFQLVAETRGMDVKAVRALEADVFVGEAAVQRGLADGVTTLDALIASLASQVKRTRPPVVPSMDAGMSASSSAFNSKPVVKPDINVPRPPARAQRERAQPNAQIHNNATNGTDMETPEIKALKRQITQLKTRIEVAEAAETQRLAARTQQQMVDDFYAELGCLRDAASTDEERNRIAHAQRQVRPATSQGKRVAAARTADFRGGFDHELAAIDRAMLGVPTATKATLVGTSLYLGTPPAPSAVDVELAKIDRSMGRPSAPVNAAEMRGTTLYLGRAPDKN